jgi:hypothetical protein
VAAGSSKFSANTVHLSLRQNGDIANPSLVTRSTETNLELDFTHLADGFDVREVRTICPNL